MPKVSNEYVNKKKAEILEAAASVFKTKPLYEITMRDIIKASGVSQGGIYLYYTDIDDILVSMINKSNAANSDYRQIVDTIIESSSNPKEAIEGLFSFLGSHIKESTSTVGKIQFELIVLCTTHPDRQNKIMSKLSEQESGQYLMAILCRKISEGISSGYFKPLLPEKDIMLFISASIDGIVENVVLQNCYSLMPQNGQFEFDPICLMNTLSKSVLSILNPNQ